MATISILKNEKIRKKSDTRKFIQALDHAYRVKKKESKCKSQPTTNYSKIKREEIKSFFE